jgi:murein DD-endopeptidase MepM/ murein hydrolase activator NlpD
VPQSGAPCGVVDTLDFPLNPPDAGQSVYGGRDFGVFRASYDGYHTGEDWWRPGRDASYGAAVHSIGHGMVTYAAPLGWGVDQGVVIVRHVLADGSTILSMYGHLQPPSVLLHVGDCVARGELLGNIGRPRSPPHLHFEIRRHLPASPGPGYWSIDPTLAGWEPPSQYIWNYRIATSPGVQWARPSAVQSTMGLWVLDPDTFVTAQDQQLVAIDLLDGDERWRQPLSLNPVGATLDAAQPIVYVADLLGRIEAYQVPDLRDGAAAATSAASPEPLWEIKLDPVGFGRLFPLPGGGVLVSSRRQMLALSSAGELLWRQNTVGRVFDWTLSDDLLIVSFEGRDGALWMIDASGPLAQVAHAGGRPVTVGDQIWMYAADGIYRLDPETLSSELLYALPPGSLWLGDMVALPDGGVLVAHTDRFDKRLISLDAGGGLHWQRSFSRITSGQQDLLLLDGSVYLASLDGTGTSREVSIFAINVQGAQLTHIFTGGTRNPLPQDGWAYAIGDHRLLINIGGGSMAVLDTQAALAAVLGATNSP